MKSFFNNNKKGLPTEAQKELQPRKEFIERGRERFLAAFDASPLARNAATLPSRTGHVTLFFKIAVGALALFCIATGVSVYADTTNVSATSPLYPLKRASEDVRLALALPAQKPAIQASFAVRRADEISALESSNPKSKLIPQLTGDLDTDIRGSLNATIEAHGGNGNGKGNGSSSNDDGSEHGYEYSHIHGNGNNSIDGNESAAVLRGTTTSSFGADDAASSNDDNDNKTLDVYCHAFDTATTGVLMARLEDQLALDPAAWMKFNARCVSGFDGGAASSSASGTAGTSLQASTTIQVHGHGWAQDADTSTNGILSLP